VALPISAIDAAPASVRPAVNRQPLSNAVVDAALASITDSDLLRQLLAEAKQNQAPIQDWLRRRLQPLKANTLQLPNEPATPAETGAALAQILGNVGLAIEAYELGLIANQSPFDDFVQRWVDGSEGSPSAYLDERFGSQELLGLSLFVGRGQCSLCHLGGAFSDSQFHNIGLPWGGGELSLGRSQGILHVLADPFNCKGIFAQNTARSDSESCKDLPFLDPNSPEAIGAFKTPTLRNVAATAPYMHDGRFRTLREVLSHYNLMSTNPAFGFKEETLRPLGLDEFELESLEKFLRSLSSPIRDLTEQNTVH
jgi:cytochrome c peroxidase